MTPLLTLSLNGDVVEIEHHDAIGNQTAELLASLVYAGANDGELQGIDPDRAAAARDELRAILNDLDRDEGLNTLAILRMVVSLEAADLGSTESCAEFAAAYAVSLEGDQEQPRKKGRPTMASGRSVAELIAERICFVCAMASPFA